MTAERGLPAEVLDASDDDQFETLVTLVRHVLQEDIEDEGRQRSQNRQPDAEMVMQAANGYLVKHQDELGQGLRDVRRLAELRDRHEVIGKSHGIRTWLGRLSLAGLLIALMMAIGRTIHELISDTPPPLAWPEIATIAASSLLVLIVCVRVDAILDERDRQREGVLNAPVEFQRESTNLREQVERLVVAPARRDAERLQFVRPADDCVTITGVPSLGARIESGARVQIQASRQLLAYLTRRGGSTVGVAGPLGAGKTELIRSFCSAGLASVELGGDVGILIPAPVAYAPEAFLRMVIRRLCEATPGYNEHGLTHPAYRPLTDRLVLGFAVTMAVLSAFYSAASFWGWGSLQPRPRAAEVAAVVGLAFLMFAAWSWARSQLVDDTASSARGQRLEVARFAQEVSRRLRYSESRTQSGDVTLSLGKVGAKLGASLGLTSLPSTEADLVSELERLVARLERAGYRVTIGIDELDKLNSSDAPEQFLNSLKSLFPIRGCSFIVSISESAWSDFVRRGLPLHDIFDSSLDNVLLVEGLTFVESREMIDRRLADFRGATHSRLEEMSDTQLLFCYTFSGGIPRELLRICRRLGEISLDLGGRQTLDTVAGRLVQEELESKADAIALASRGRTPTTPGLELSIKLDHLVDLTPYDWVQELTEFLESDPRFVELVGRANGFDPDQSCEPKHPDEWTQPRRQLYCYIYFLHTLWHIFVQDRAKPISDLLVPFDILARARRRLEVNPATSWRRVSQARMMLGIDPIAMWHR